MTTATATHTLTGCLDPALDGTPCTILGPVDIWDKRSHHLAADADRLGAWVWIETPRGQNCVLRSRVR